MHLDQTLGESVRDEHRFLQYCRSLERALSDASLFGSLNYDPDGATAHIFAGDLRAVADYLVHGDDQRCIRFSEFLPAALGTLPLDSAGPIELVSDLDGSGDLARFKLLRLASVYAACIPFLGEFGLPFRDEHDLAPALAIGDRLTNSDAAFLARIEEIGCPVRES